MFGRGTGPALAAGDWNGCANQEDTDNQNSVHQGLLAVPAKWLGYGGGEGAGIAIPLTKTEQRLLRVNHVTPEPLPIADI